VLLWQIFEGHAKRCRTASYAEQLTWRCVYRQWACYQPLHASHWLLLLTALINITLPKLRPTHPHQLHTKPMCRSACLQLCFTMFVYNAYNVVIRKHLPFFDASLAIPDTCVYTCCGLILRGGQSVCAVLGVVPLDSAASSSSQWPAYSSQ